MNRPLLIAISCTPLVAQQSTAVFDAPVVQMPDDSAPFQRLFDYDGDGDQDAVGGRVKSDGTQYEVRVWRNQGGRYVLAFTDLQNAIAGTSSSIVVGDFDNDGDRDFLFGTGFEIYRYTNTNGNWSRSTFASFPTFNGLRLGPLAAGDFDGNGSLDVAALLRDPTVPAIPGELRLFRTGSAPVVFVTPANYTFSTALEVFQADGDAAMEIALWGGSSWNSFQPMDLVGGVLVPMAPMTATLAGPAQGAIWATGDIDGDADVDVVAFEGPGSTTPARVHCFRRNGATTWSAEAAYLGGPAEYLVDIDGDGDLDGACCGGGGGPPYWPMVDFGSTFELSLNNGQGTFAPSFQMAGKGSTRMAGATDVDLDGFIDLVAGAVVYYGRGSFGAALSPPAAMLDDLFSWSWLHRRGAQLGDFDGDGDVDFPSTLFKQGVNDGSGAWQVRPTAWASLPPGIAVGTPHFRGDFDGDGAVDYVVKVRIGGVFSHTAFLRNNGSGVLSYAGVAAAAAIGGLADAPVGGDTAALTADLDGDGDIDIVANSDAAYQLPYQSAVWWNQGNGTFVAGPPLPTERIELAADFDGDGRPDLLTRAAINGAPAIRLGTGVSATPFGPPIPALPIRTYDLYADAFQVVDANDDGRRDILARVSTANSTIEFLLACNVTTAFGQPTFQAANGLLPPGRPGLGSVVVMDVDGDQRSDLVQMSPLGATFVARIRRRLSGDGQVLQNTHYGTAVDQVIWNGHPADVDADGDLDLVGSRVVRNVRFHGSAAGLRRQLPGNGSPGEAGVVPLFGIGPIVRAGERAEYRLSGVTGPSVAVMVIANAPAYLPNLPAVGVTCLVDPSAAVLGLVLLPEDGGGQARGTATIPVFFPPGLQGAQFFDQVFVLDASVPSWFAASNGLQKVIGG